MKHNEYNTYCGIVSCYLPPSKIEEIDYDIESINELAAIDNYLNQLGITLTKDTE